MGALGYSSRSTALAVLGPAEVVVADVHFFKSVSERVLEVAIKAELAGDYIRELAIKYS